MAIEDDIGLAFSLVEQDALLGNPTDEPFDRDDHPADVEPVTIDASIGGIPGWMRRADSGLWVVATHGRTAGMDQTYGRYNDALTQLGVNVLYHTYRNGFGAPTSEHGESRYGETEKAEVWDAVRLVVDNGAEEVVFLGDSQATAIQLAAWLDWPIDFNPGLFKGLVAGGGPVLDLTSIFKYQQDLAIQAGLFPEYSWEEFGAIIQDRLSEKYGIDFESLNCIGHAAMLELPMLVQHPFFDGRVPYATSQAMADARPDLVTLRPVMLGDHVEEHMVDGARFRQSVVDFIRHVAHPA